MSYNRHYQFQLLKFSRNHRRRNKNWKTERSKVYGRVRYCARSEITWGCKFLWLWIEKNDVFNNKSILKKGYVTVRSTLWIGSTTIFHFKLNSLFKIENLLFGLFLGWSWWSLDLASMIFIQRDLSYPAKMRSIQSMMSIFVPVAPTAMIYGP